MSLNHTNILLSKTIPVVALVKSISSHKIFARQPYDTIDLLNDEIEDTNSIGETLISPFVHPLKYRLELTPIINGNGVSRLKGRVIIEFQVNDTTGLDQLSLNAKNITVTNYKLSLLDLGVENIQSKRKRRRRDDNVTSESLEDDETLGNAFDFIISNDISLNTRASHK